MKIYFIGFGLLLLLLACSPKPQEVTNHSNEFEFQENLSDYHFFKGGLAQLEPESGVLPYELNTTLFSDYAHKARFIKLPEGTKMTLEEAELNFPEGTILIKNFFYLHNEQKPALGKRLLETRLLVKHEDEWLVANYEWNEDQTDAKRNILGGKKLVRWIDDAGIEREVQYLIPDNNDCKSCHKKNGAVVPIGPKVRNLNKLVAHEGKEFSNQLVVWKEKGFIDLLGRDPHEFPQLPIWDDASNYNLEGRARAYLDVNCAHCHSKEGPASNTGLFLTYEEQSNQRIGIFKGPVSAAQGSGDLMYDIVPGNADASIVVYRMNSAETGIAMPEIGKTIIHEEGVALIAEWINEMEEVLR